MNYRSILKFLTLLCVVCGSSASGATVAWDGDGNDNSWQTPENWSGNALPADGDDVIIDSPAPVTVVSSANVTIRSLQCSNHLEIASGTFSCTGGASKVYGDLTLGSRVTLSVAGSGTTFTGTGSVQADQGAFSVTDGAVLSLPTLAAYSKGTSCIFTTWRVSGAGSRLELPNLTDLAGGRCVALGIEAVNGGAVLVPGVATPQDGHVSVLADGTNSVVDLSGLQHCPGTSRNTTLEARNGGEVRVPQLSGGPRVFVVLKPDGILPIDQLTELRGITVEGRAEVFPALTSFDNGNIEVSAGGDVTLPMLTSYAKGAGCGTSSWRVAGPGSRLDLSSLTDLTGGQCAPVMIQALDGGTVLLTGILTLPDGHVSALADGTNSLVDLSSLRQCLGEVRTTSLEARNGGTLRAPQLLGGAKLSVTLKPGGSLPVSQLTELSAITIEGRTEVFPSLIEFDDGKIELSGGAVATLPNLTRYGKGIGCGTLLWRVTGPGSLLDLNSLTNLTGGRCAPVVIQAIAGGAVLLTNITALPDGHVSVVADGTNSLVDLSSLQECLGAVRTTSLEVRDGGTIRVPQLVGGAKVAVTLKPGGILPTAQLVQLSGITVEGRAETFPSLVQFDDGQFELNSGATLAVPSLTHYTKGNSCAALTWEVRGPGTVLDLSSLTNLTGGSCAPVTIRTFEGGTVLLPGVTAFPDGHVSVLADGADSLIDLPALLECPGTVRTTTLEARNDGTVSVPQLAGGPNVAVVLKPGGIMPVGQMVELGRVVVEERPADFPSLVRFDDGSVNVSGGAAVTFPMLSSYTRGSGCAIIEWEVSGPNTLLDASSLTNITGGSCGFLHLNALTGGELRLSGVQSMPTGNIHVLADGAGSVVDLRRLTLFFNLGRLSRLEATRGGTILLNQDPFLLSNVAVEFAMGNPALPAASIDGSMLTLHGQAWKSYWIEKRYAGQPAAPWAFFKRVPLTNDFQEIAPPPFPDDEFQVWEFVADPAIIDLSRSGTNGVATVLYGAPAKSYRVLSTTAVETLPAAWDFWDTTGVMTNSFRIFPHTPPADTRRFFRSMEE